MTLGKSQNWIIKVLICMILIIPVVLEVNDHTITGDEVVTYSMANNSDGGFVFSEGRVASYLKAHVFSDSLAETFSNIITEAKDVIQNRKNARFFTYMPDSEVHYYTHDEMLDWFEKRDYERFNLGDTWLFSQSDDANSYLYYCLLNVVSSLFTPISSTKWSGFILNYLLYLLLLYSIFQLTKHLKIDRSAGLLMTFLIGMSYEVLTKLIYIRSYVLATILVVWIAIYHIDLWNHTLSEENSTNRRFPYVSIIPLMMCAYISHYTTSIVMASFGFISVVFLAKRKKAKELGVYIGTCLLAGVLSIVIDPVSIAGLLSKVSSSSGASSLLMEAYQYFFYSVFPTVFFFIWFLTLLFLSKGKGIVLFWNDIVYRLLFFVLLVYSFVILAGTKGPRYLSVITPVILLVMLLIIYYTISSLSGSIKKASSIVTIFLFLLMNIYLSFSSLSELNTKNAQLQSIVRHNEGKDCIYFRVRRSGYELVPYIMEFNDAQIITTTTENWQNLVSDEILKSSGYIVIFNKDSRTKEVDRWLEDNKISLSSNLYNDSLIGIYLADKE